MDHLNSVILGIISSSIRYELFCSMISLMKCVLSFSGGIASSEVM